MYSDAFFIYGHIKNFIEILRMIENQVVQIIILCVWLPCIFVKYISEYYTFMSSRYTLLCMRKLLF